MAGKVRRLRLVYICFWKENESFLMIALSDGKSCHPHHQQNQKEMTGNEMRKMKKVKCDVDNNKSPSHTGVCMH